MPVPLRLGIIGTGIIVDKKHWPALALLGARFEVAALANRTPARATVLAEGIAAAGFPRPTVYADYHEMLAREPLDAVSLCLPPDRNPEVVEAALQAGRHVIAEKPLATTLADGERMLDWAERYGRTLMIAENYRYMAGFREAAQRMAAGSIGRPQTAHWHVYAHIPEDSPYLRTDWRRTPVLPGGFLSDGGVHHATVFRMLLGEVSEAAAFTQTWRPDLPPLDTLSAALRFANGATGVYAVSYATAGPFTMLEIGGTKGVLRAGRDRVEVWRRGAELETWQGPNPVDGLVRMYEEFADAIGEGRAPQTTAAESLADLRLTLALLRAAETGRAVRVAEMT